MINFKIQERKKYLMKCSLGRHCLVKYRLGGCSMTVVPIMQISHNEKLFFLSNHLISDKYDCLILNYPYSFKKEYEHS